MNVAESQSPLPLSLEVDREIDSILSEVDSLKQEIEQLRKRDQAVNFYMQRIDEELRLAARLQRDFLPKQLPQVGNIHFHTLFRPANYVSGDLYDVMRLDETHVGFYMADAVGHGMPAALLTMFIKNALVTKEITPDGYRLLEPSQTIARLNDGLVSQKLSHATFATALYGYVNTAIDEVTFARAGHPNPVVLRADGSVFSPESDGCLLGIFEGETFTEGKVKLYPGDRLFLFTDGIEVVFGGETALNCAQWCDELRSRQSMTASEIIDDFARLIDQAAGSIEPKDDLTIIIAERRG
jgi:sigma-B regulation protein RsbU (phosphoserine phosphatase)